MKNVSNLGEVSQTFALYCLGAALSQIVGTGLLLSLFGERNFAIGITYSKTESLLTAFFGWVLFYEQLPMMGLFAILVGVTGVMLVSLVDDRLNLSNIMRAVTSKVAFKGLLCGTAFSFAGLLIRQATLTLSGSFMMSAAFALLFVLSIQSLALGSWIVFKDRQSFSAILQQWKPCAIVGLTSSLGSIGWFTAFALTNVAYVKTVGQIELLFSAIVTHHFFKEKISKTETVGMLFVVGSIVLLVFSI